MNDRFRFRVWNTRTKKLREVAQITLDARQHGRTSEISNMETCHLVYQPHLVLEQCTGLKDKNGRLIYEGDIVRVKNIYLTNNNFQGKVCYGHFYFSACEEYTCRRLGYFIKVAWSAYVKNTGFALGEEEREYEVIGNIHENPDLLEEKTEKPIL